MNFQTLSQLAVLCEERGLGIGALMLEEQSAESGRPQSQEFATMKEYYGVMKEAVHRGMTQDTTSRSGLTASMPSGWAIIIRLVSRYWADLPGRQWPMRWRYRK